MTRLAFADDDARLDVERGKQRGGAIAFVVVRHRLRPALLHRQAGLRSVERLDLALLIDAQHHRLVRRAHVETHDVGNLLLEVRIVRDLERVDPVRLETGLAPDPSDTRRADPGRLGHRCAAPVRRVRRRLRRRLRQNGELDLLGQSRNARGACLVAQKTIHAFVDEALLPAPDARLRFAGAPHDLVGAGAIGRRQHDLGAPNGLARTVAILDDRFQPRPVRQAHIKADVISSHARTLTDLRRHGKHPSDGEH